MTRTPENKDCSLFSNAFASASPAGHRMVNSPRVDMQKQESAQPQLEVFSLQFPVALGTTGGQGQLRITRLTSLDADVLLWIEEFRLAHSLCNWSIPDAVKVLQTLVSRSLLVRVDISSGIDSALDQLARLKYNDNNLPILKREARSIRQSQYERISQYRDALSEAVHRVAVAANWTQEQQGGFQEELFLEGLTLATRKELLRMRITSEPAACEYIAQVEDALLRADLTEEGAEEPSSPSLASLSEPQVTAPRQPINKWCALHETSTHDDSECIAQKQARDLPARQHPAKSKKKDRKYDSVNLITQRETVHRLRTLSIRINGQPVTAVLDCGSTLNCIKPEVASRLGLQVPAEAQCPQTATAPRPRSATGSTVQVTGLVNATLAFNHDNSLMCKTEMAMVPHLCQEVILGIPFLRLYKATLDFGENTLRVSERAIPLGSGPTSDLPIVDREPLVKVEVCLPRSTQTEELSKPPCPCIVAKPQLVSALTADTNLLLQTDQPVRRKPLPTPYARQPEVATEIERVPSLGAARRPRPCRTCPFLPTRRKTCLPSDYRTLDNTPGQQPEPRNVSDLRRILRLISRFRPYIADQNSLFEAFPAKTRKGSPFISTNQDQTQLDKTHDLILEATLQRFPDPPSKPQRLETDARDVDIGAVHTQDRHPIQPPSRAPTSTQSRNTTMEGATSDRRKPEALQMPDPIRNSPVKSCPPTLT